MNQKYIIGLIGSIREGYNKFLEKELDKKGITGLVSSHGAILSVLYKHNGTLPVLQIADLINRTKSTVTELIAKLEKNEYVIKKPNPDDKRSTLIELTKKGQSIQQSFYEISENLIKTTYKGFTEEEKDQLIALLLKVKKNFK